jgi:hypothetical protein
MTQRGGPWPNIDGHRFKVQTTALAVAKANGYIDEVNTTPQRYEPDEPKYYRVAQSNGALGWLGMGPVIHFARASAYDQRQLTAHADEIEFVLSLLERLTTFELTRQNWSEYLSAWSSLQKIFHEMNRIVEGHGSSREEPQAILPNRKVYDNLRKLLYPEEMSQAPGEASGPKHATQAAARSKIELHRALEPEYGEFGNYLKTPKQTIATLRRLRPCFGKVGPPVAMLNAAKTTLGRLLCGPYYATIVRELNLELADIKQVVETKSKAAALASFGVLSLGIGTSNFLARLAYDYSGWNPYDNE